MGTRQDGPFPYYDEIHPGIDPGSIRGTTAQPSTDAAALRELSIDLGGDERRVGAHVEGSIVADVRANPRAAQKDAAQLAANGTYAVGLLLDFAGRVQAFDDKVSGINADYRERVHSLYLAHVHDPEVRREATPFDRVAVGNMVEADLRPRYRRAEGELDDDAGEIAHKFRAGPTDDNVRALIRSGLIPLDAAPLYPTLELTAADKQAARSASLFQQFFDEWGGFKPPLGKGPVDWANYAFGQLGFGVGTGLSWWGTVSIGRFAPINALGRTVPLSSLTAWDRFRAGLGRFPTAKGLSAWERFRGFDRGAAFRADPYKSVTRARFGTAGSLLSKAGGVASGAFSGWQEWQEDAAYPTDERAGRAVTKGVATGVGAWAGAETGAWVGGAIGTAICPGVGTVVGGAIGGVIGGFAGSKLGEEAGDLLKDAGGWVGDKTGDLIEDAGDVASDVGDAITFWD